MTKEYDYIIVGAGLCGLVLAKELNNKNKRVLILERGNFINKLGKVRYTFGFYDRWLALIGSRQGVNIYRVFGVGGTSIVSCGNAVEFTEEEYNRIGINIKEELAETKNESYIELKGLPISRASAKIMEVANKLGYDMHPMPKFSIAGYCSNCGYCEIGCASVAKWTSRECLKGINKENTDLITGFSVKRVINNATKAEGIEGSLNFGTRKYFADKIILCAGGIGTPIILQNSGIEAGDNLFVDLFNVTYGVSDEFNQKKELVMSTVCEKFHKTDGFVLSPFVDNWLSLSTSVEFWNILRVFQLNSLMGIMTKIADDSVGRVYPDGKVDKAPTQNDLEKLKKGTNMAKEILVKCGVNPKSIFVTKPRGAHPGGTAAIGRVVDKNLETKVKNLYVCDAGVLPFAPGLPPILSLIALSKWFSRKVLEV